MGDGGKKLQADMRGLGVSEWSEGKRSEPERHGETPNPARTMPGVSGVPRSAANTEVMEKPVRRRFSAEYKAKILNEADACSELGQIGALLRREALYSSILVNWRRQREKGKIEALAPKKRGRKGSSKDPLLIENERLRREKERLERRLKQAETIIEVQKKVSEILGIPLNPPSEGENA